MSKNNKPVAGSTPTTQKIAFQTGAAKDELFRSALNEDQQSNTLNVLANDPGSAKLYSLAQGITPSSVQVEVLDRVILASGAVISIENGMVRYDISKVNHQSLAQGQVAIDTFEYVIQMGNGALSIATATVEVIGLNDAPTLEALPLDPIVIEDTSGPASSQSFEGQLRGSDVDDGAVLTYGFAQPEDVVVNADGTVSLSGDYGTLVIDSTSGQYTFTVNAQALDDLSAGQIIPLNFDVLVRDEHGAVSNVETIKFELQGADEAPLVSEPSFGDVTTFVVNHGLDFVNERGVLHGFDRNDRLKLAGVKQVSDIYTVDTDGDGRADSSALLVQFTHGGKGNENEALIETVEIVLTGYLDLTQDQIFASAN